jgi:3-methyladenine DNA glycosylase/8-oxoguanine DNA glycosylase
MVRAAREVASGRVDLRDPHHEKGWRRLRAIPGIGSWTQEILALHGQGRYDQIPAGDLSFVKFVGYMNSGGDPRVRATEDEVREFFAPYEGWAGLAGAHAIRSPVLAAGRRSAPARTVAA